MQKTPVTRNSHAGSFTISGSAQQSSYKFVPKWNPSSLLEQSKSAKSILTANKLKSSTSQKKLTTIESEQALKVAGDLTPIKQLKAT